MNEGMKKTWQPQATIRKSSVPNMGIQMRETTNRKPQIAVCSKIAKPWS